MKATFNLKTKELIITGKEIEPFKHIIEEGWEDFWHSVATKKTGEPLYDINLFIMDDDKGDMDINNYSLGYYNLVTDSSGQIHIDKFKDNIKLRVTKGEFNPMKATFHAKVDGDVIFKTKRLNRISDFTVDHEKQFPTLIIVAIDDFGFEKIIT